MSIVLTSETLTLSITVLLLRFDILSTKELKIEFEPYFLITFS